MINTYNEKSLHAALKAWYAGEGGQLEVPVDGYVADIVRDDLLIEIQTASFASIKQKLLALTESRKVLLVYPVAREKWVVRLPGNGAPISERTRRKSPRRGMVLDLFTELVSFPALVALPNFEVEVAFTQEDELRTYDRRRGWRRKGWVIADRELLDVVDRRRFACPTDFAPLIPDALPQQFTTGDMARVTGRSRRFGGQMTYCLREMGLIEAVGRGQRGVLYRRMT
jgi:hypothetical protein